MNPETQPMLDPGGAARAASSLCVSPETDNPSAPSSSLENQKCPTPNAQCNSPAAPSPSSPVNSSPNPVPPVNPVKNFSSFALFTQDQLLQISAWLDDHIYDEVIKLTKNKY